MLEPSNNLPLLPQYQQWVDEWVMTEPEAQQLQFLTQAALAGLDPDPTQAMVPELQKLALHGLVDAETATRH